MNKIYFILLLLLGFFLMPSVTYACGSGSGEHSCKMEMTSKSKKHDCCSKKSKSNKSCTGKCGQAMCSVSPVNIGVTNPNQFEMPKPLFGILEKEQNFSLVLSVPLDGYDSLWLIPKIG